MKILLPIVIFILIFLTIKVIEDSNLSKPVEFGVTFSDKYAKYLGLNPEKVLEDTLSELNISIVRLPAYWDQIEPEQGKFEFKNLDSYIEIAGKHKSKVILVIGLKAPRWPECHSPLWVEKLTTEQKQQAQLKMMKKVIQRYDKNNTVISWQVENEPMMAFGECGSLDKQFLVKEVDFVRSLTNKPIVITDSGEVRSWIIPAKLSDVLGISLYRFVYHPNFGYINYPIPAFFYSAKSFLVNKFFAPKKNQSLSLRDQKTIISELQAEAWLEKGVQDTSLEEQIKNFPAQNISTNISYAKKTGFSEILLWGVEWWYFMKEKGHPEYWQVAKDSLF